MDITATTASTGNYVSQFIEQIPEPLPSNLAGQVYDSVKDLTYSGSIRLEEDEVSETIGIGMVFNVTNGAIEWSTMNALVVSITEDVDAGVTEAQFGPPQHLGVADLVELMRVARNRKLTPALFWRTGTSVSQDQALQLGDFTGGQDTAPADDYQDRSVITPMPDPAGPPPPITSGMILQATGPRLVSRQLFFTLNYPMKPDS